MHGSGLLRTGPAGMAWDGQSGELPALGLSRNPRTSSRTAGLGRSQGWASLARMTTKYGHSQGRTWPKGLPGMTLDLTGITDLSAGLLGNGLQLSPIFGGLAVKRPSRSGPIFGGLLSGLARKPRVPSWIWPKPRSPGLPAGSPFLGPGLPGSGTSIWPGRPSGDPGMAGPGQIWGRS